MNINEIFNIMITSLALGVRFIPIISISELFGGRFTPLYVKSSLVAILGFFRFSTASHNEINYGFSIPFIITEFFFGFMIALPFILMTKLIISSSSTIENLFGSMGILNSQGIFDDRSSALEILFEMLVILLIFIPGTHLFILKLLLLPHPFTLTNTGIEEIVFKIISDFNIISKNASGYFFPLFIAAFSSVIVLSLADLLGTNLNLSSQSFLLNSMIIIAGILFFIDKICTLLKIDISRIQNLSSYISDIMR